MSMQNIPQHDKPMTLGSHLQEFKTRVIYCCIFFVICFGFSYYFSENILYFIAQPLLKIIGNRMIYTSITEPFFVYIKIAGLTALALAIPFLMIQIYLFISPALHYNEKKWIAGTGIVFVSMFVIGMSLMYYAILPIGIKFLMTYNKAQSLILQLQAKLSDYIEMIFQLSIGFGLAFELPVLLVILAKIGIISYRHLQKFRRLAVVLIFIIAAVVTPPDVLSQVILGVIMMAFYEITILICKYIQPN